MFSVLLCFFKFCWFQLCLLRSARLPATFVFPPVTAFQAFGTALLNSRLPCFICWTLPSYHSQHNTLGCQPRKGAATFLGSCWEYVSRPASCHVAAPCVPALRGFARFQQYTAFAVQAQRLRFPEQLVFYTWCLALTQNTKWRSQLSERKV